MKKKIRCIVKRPNEPIGHFVTLDNRLEVFQKIVGGYIEAVTFLHGATCICNEEGKLKNLPHNFTLYGENIVGPVVIVGVDGEDCCDCPIDIDTWKLFLKEWGNEV